MVNQLWINEFLSENIDKVLEYCGIDVIAEVGMCFKLARQQNIYAGAVQKIDSHIMKKYNLKTRLSDKFLVKREHTNCLIMLLFMDIEHWHSGPYFS
ncbi:MAG: hypothetical protein JJT87_14155 [Halomonas sp.]|nr:hypothetical protein [Halomonas sp.]MCC5903052.1 hypothetical protein [Halomonas sp.]